MIGLDGANLLPPPPPNVVIDVFDVVDVVDDVVFVIFGEGGAPLETIEGLPHLLLVPVSPYLPKPMDLRFPHGGVVNTKGACRAPPPLTPTTTSLPESSIPCFFATYSLILILALPYLIYLITPPHHLFHLSQYVI